MRGRSTISFHFNVVLFFAYPIPTTRKTHQKYFFAHIITRNILKGIIPKLLNYKIFFIFVVKTILLCIHAFIFWS